MVNRSGPPSARLHWLLLAIAFAGCAAGNPHREAPSLGADAVLDPAYHEVRDEAASLIRRVCKKHGIQGLSIALVDNQRLVWAEGFGYADTARGIPASPRTVYRAGSLAKPFTAKSTCATRATWDVG